MRFAVISDVHGNLTALRAVVGAIRAEEDVDRIVCAGDVVGLGPHPNEIIDVLREEAIEAVRGNYDEAVARERLSSGVDFPDSMAEEVDRIAVAWTRKVLTPENREYLHDLPRDIRLFGVGRSVSVKRNAEDERISEYRRTFFVRAFVGGLAKSRPRRRAPRVSVSHGSPRAVNEFIRPDTATSILDAIARVAQTDVLITGHSGMGYVREAAGMTFIGVGSVSGMRAAPGEAEYGIVDIGPEIRAEFRRVSYDPTDHVRAIVNVGLPPALAANFDLSSL